MSAPDAGAALPGLPAGWTVRAAAPADAPALTALLRAHEEAARGWAGSGMDDVAATLEGHGAQVRRHTLVVDADGAPVGWSVAYDRAAGHVVVEVTVSRLLADEVADAVAGRCFVTAYEQGARITRERGLADSQLDSGAFAQDERQHRWLRAAGYEHARDWWQMSRPVPPGEAERLPGPRAGVVVRPVRTDADGRPVEDDVRAVHDVLEASFADHFNSYRETFDEFVGRLGELPGHRWDHWWLAEVDGRIAGALVGSVLPQNAAGAEGSYIEYIGVDSRARGRGVAKALLHTVIADAAERGRDRVGLEVDADSPTGADGLYTSMGWSTVYVTQSWHRGVAAAAG